MEEKLKYWSKRYKLNNLKIVGYQGGYPIIQFDKNDDMAVTDMSEREINRHIRSAEMGGGIELGVGYNFRRTAFLRINDDSIVICGHEYVLDRILGLIF